MSKIYVGTVVAIDDSYKFGFIDRKSLKYTDGSKAILDTDADIFVHLDQSDTLLEEGVQLTFSVEKDAKRKKAFRVSEAVRLRDEMPIYNGIRLHFDERTIEHPMVPIRWCIEPEMFDAMNRHSDENWYIAIIAQPRSVNGHWIDRDQIVFQSFIGLRDMAMGRNFLTFKAPGDYDVAIYLVRTKEDLADVRQKHREISGHSAQIWEDSEKGVLAVWRESRNSRLPFLPYGGNINVVTAVSRTSVSVPDGIFAKPLSAGMKTYLSYFGLHDPKDECSTRGRVALACIVGAPWLVIWETFKRSWMFFSGGIHFLLGSNPRPFWKETFTPYLSADSCMPWDEEVEKMEIYNGWGILLHPMLLLLVFMTGLMYFVFPETYHIFLISMIGTFVCCVGAVFLGFWLKEKWRARETQKQVRQFEKEEQRKLLVYQERTSAISQVRQYTSCESETPVERPMDVRLVLANIKRKVCRTYRV